MPMQSDQIERVKRIDGTDDTAQGAHPTPAIGAQFSATARALATSFAALTLAHSSPAEPTQIMAAPGGPAPAVHPELSPRQLTNQRLDKMLSIQPSSAKVGQILELISTISGVPIEGCWTSTESEDASPLVRELTFATGRVTVRSALDTLADKISLEDMPVAWQVLADGRVQFGSKSALNQFKEMKIYQVKDLLIAHPEFTSAPEIDITSALQQGQGTGGSSILRENQGTKQSVQTPENSIQNLKELILNSVEPEQWEERGGTGGSVRSYQGTLIINAAPYIHRQLE